MSSVIFKFAHWQPLGTNSWIHTGSSRRNKQLIPNTKPIASRTSIPDNIIQRMSNPYTTSLHISLYKCPYLSSINNKIILDKIMCLSTIFNKNSMPTDIVSHCVCYSEEMDTMDCGYSGKTLMNCIAISVT